MRIQGNLATYEFSDLLQWLAQGNKTGVLTVTDGGVEYQLGFDHGRIDMSSSSDPSQRLDNYLFARGVIDQATLDRAERLRDATKMMSGQVLVTLGAVTEAQLAKALRDKTEEILCELLTWDQGTFEFEGGERAETTMVPIGLEVTKLLLESMHRLDQQRGGVPDPPHPQPSAAFVVTEPSEPTPSPDATQAIEGLALAQVLDPESPVETPVATAASPAEQDSTADLTPHYAAMAETPGPLRRMAPFALVLVLSLAAGAFYLANRQADAEPMDGLPGGKPILFSQTLGPPKPQVDTSNAAPDATVEPVAPTTAELGQAEEALRQRYEEQLAGLRRELEEARRQAQPAALEPNTRIAPGSETELPADSIMRAAVTRAPTAKPPATTAPTPPGSSETRSSADTAPPVVPAAAETAIQSPPLPEAVQPPPADTQLAPAPSFEIVNPKLVARPAPRYPVAAQRHRRGAVLRMRVLIGLDGRVVKAERIGPKAGLGFDKAAEDAALASTWEPGTRGGEATEMWAELRFEFKP